MRLMSPLFAARCFGAFLKPYTGSMTSSRRLYSSPNDNNNNAPPLSARPILKAIVLDMDGTLTKPNLDFNLMYQRCGVDRNHDILKAISQMPPTERQKAEMIVEEMEQEGRDTLQLLPGASEFLDWCKRHKLPTALVTRNTRETVNVLEKLLLAEKKGNDSHHPTAHPSLFFDHVVTRDDGGDFPPKPNPEALWGICHLLNITADQGILMVGDSPSHDVAFGKAAGVSTALLDTNSAGNVQPENSNGADFVVSDLSLLARTVWMNFTLEGELGTHVPLQKYQIPKPTSRAALAAVNGDLETLMKLPNIELDQHDKIDSNEDDDDSKSTSAAGSNTALVWAANAGQDEAVAWLVQQDGIDLDRRGYLGATAVCRAARNGNVEIVRILAKAGANLDIPNIKMQYPLHFAAFKNHPRVVDVLLEFGANPRVLDRKGRAPSLDTRNDAICARLEQAMQAE